MVKKYNFHNDRKFIRVTEVSTNIVTFINKSNIIIQIYNIDYFFIKNDSYIRYFKYTAVQYPETTALEDLLLLLVTMSQSEDNSQVIITNEIEKSDVVFSLNVHSDKDDINFSEYNEGADNYSKFDKKKVIMGLSNIDIGSTNINVRQSKQYINIPSGKTSISMISATLIHNNVSTNPVDLVTDSNHVISRIGLFDDVNMIQGNANMNFVHGNGIYLEYNSQSNVALYSNVNIVLKKESAMISIPQADWNIDPLNGRGSSGRTLNVNSAHTYVFKCGNVPNANLSVGLVINGDVIIFHEFDVTNEEYDFFSKLPIRWEIKQDNIGGAAVIDSPFELHQYNAIVYSNEKYFNSRNTVSTNTKFCEITDIADKCMLFQIRLDPRYIRTNIKLKKINIINVNQDTSMVLWKLIKNGTSHTYNYTPESSDGTAAKYKYGNNHSESTDVDIGASPYVHQNQSSRPDYIESKSKCQMISYDSKMKEWDGVTSSQFDNYIVIENGYTITSGYIVGYGQTEIDLSDFSAILNANIQGESDNISLVIEHINSTAEIQACVTWEEYE
jgi:hypothetical protein